ncbi:hypothetical protein MLD38_024301 [Melastoma candidum]|uniref:Uncharacterized protein n=1 Tax=Melastoma candidum TaxID=119954 RepID=A0ACB9NT66_9MYRT|nr:hypothetical protein MLD38_024301 [Melastoma candidum]
MPFGLVSAWNKRRRSMSLEYADPWSYKSGKFWQSEDQSSSSQEKRRGSAVFTLKEMEEATSGFSDGNLVGKGGFGRVYRGVFRSGEVVAIKKMDVPAYRIAEGEREFRVEVDILSRLNHPNLVSLIGYCADGKQRFLVYEFMEKGNLQDLLNGNEKAEMDWPTRLKVATGAAKGLAYLHSGSAVGIPIIHRDFKSSNILLTSDFEAKISDFGLAKLMPKDQEVCETARMLGTFGYFDPEYTSTGKVTLQTDVYAFGMVLLELLTGRRAIELNQGPNDQNLVLQVRNILSNKKKLRKIIDADISQSSYTMESVTMFVNLASRCVRLESNERPSMAECVKELQLICFINLKGQVRGLHSFITG